MSGFDPSGPPRGVVRHRSAIPYPNNYNDGDDERLLDHGKNRRVLIQQTTSSAKSAGARARGDHSDYDDDDKHDFTTTDLLDVSIKIKRSSSGSAKLNSARRRRIYRFAMLTAVLAFGIGQQIRQLISISGTDGGRGRRWDAPMILRKNVRYADTIVFARRSAAAGTLSLAGGVEQQLVFAQPPPGTLVVAANSSDPDFGGLNLNPAPTDFQRELQKHDDRLLDWYRDDVHMAYFANQKEEWFWDYADAYVDPKKTCIWPAKVYRQIPTCNPFHEIAFDQPRNEFSNIKYLGSGYYRDTWLVRQATTTSPSPATATTPTSYVIKRHRYKRLTSRNRYAKILAEAVIMDQLAASDRITNIYGHCAFSIIVEAGAFDMRNSILPDSEYQHDGVPGTISQTALDALSVTDAHPMNNFTAAEKLQLLLTMAESMAEVHGLPTGPAVVSDIAVSQWLRAVDGQRLILNDFDNANFLPWDFNSQQYCQYESGYLGGFKSPEERHYGWLDESVDMWKFGSLIFAVLTGLTPYYSEEQNHRDSWNPYDAGVLPTFDPRYATRSFIESRLVELMRKCHQFRPADRATIFEVVAHLRETQRLHKKKA